MVQLTLSQACDQFNRYLRATGKSKHTIADYNNSLRKLRRFLPQDPLIADLTLADLERFFDDLRTRKVKPNGIAPRPARRLSKKSIQNVHTGLSSLWTWATERQIVDANLLHSIKVKAPDPPPIEVFTEEEIQTLLEACGHSAAWKDRPDTRHRIPRHLMLRDQAIILFLLDTGVRASELCGLTLDKVDMDARSAEIISITAKNSKSRFVQFGRRAALGLLDYLATRPDAIPNDPLFTTITRRWNWSEEHMKRRHMGAHLRKIGQRAGIEGVYPHRFRHTFATQFLRNGGDPYILKDLLGHTSLEMVYRYVHFVQADIAAAHRRASPADNWKLRLNK